MADWGQRASNKDRDKAIELIEAAAARGQIIDADKAKRIQEVRAATTIGEIGLVTRGLGLPEPAGVAPPAPPPVSEPATPSQPTFEPYSPPQTPPVSELGVPAAPPHHVQYGEPLTSSSGSVIYGKSTARSSGASGKFVLLFVLILFAGIAIPIFIGIKSVVDTAGGVINDLNPETPDVISEQGLADLTAAIEEETGSIEAFRVVLYPEYAVVTAPADDSSKRSINYYWNGNLSESTKGTDTVGERFDMADIDAAVLTKLLGRARKLVEGATTQYVIVSPPTLDDNAYISAYASNDFNETGYIAATFEGKVVRKVSP